MKKKKKEKKDQKKKKFLYTSLILSHNHSTNTSPFFISLSKKNILKEVKKREENILYTLSFSRYHPHRPLSFLSLLEKQTQKY